MEFLKTRSIGFVSSRTNYIQCHATRSVIDFGCSCNFEFNLLNHKVLGSSKLAAKGLEVLEPTITFNAMPLEVWLTLVVHVILSNLLNPKALRSS